jgi:hypothetical protein
MPTMISPAWQNETISPRRKGQPLWLQAFLVISAGLLILCSTLGLQARNGRVTAWNSFRNVMAQIRNETEARALYRRSPDLAGRFASEAGFLDYLRTYQTVIQTPPRVEPINDGDRYLVFPLPTTTSVQFRFEDGTTVSVGIRSPGLFRSFPPGQEVLDRFDIHAVRMLTGPRHE